jgi:hypothetical protein
MDAEKLRKAAGPPSIAAGPALTKHRGASHITQNAFGLGDAAASEPSKDKFCETSRYQGAMASSPKETSRRGLRLISA